MTGPRPKKGKQPAAINLREYKLRDADDPVKVELELVHLPCRIHLCDAEPGDHMDTLFGVIVDHADTCPA
ncbi:hypothetical protein [Streptomyces sp. NPDC004763]